MVQQQSPRRVATIIWAALVIGPLVLLAVALRTPMPGDAQLAALLLPIVSVLSIVEVALSWFWAVRMRPRLPPGATPHTPDQLALTRLIVASALCEGAALFALVAFFITRDPLTLLPFALCFLALLSHFPGDRHWAQLTGVPGGATRNPMIRG